jgi:(E)-4-hydroxy-3-methylbut-2-enyl-diphosphate synthase
VQITRNPTRSVSIGSIAIGADHPVAVQSMTATHTQNIDATVEQVNALYAAGADLVRVAVDNTKDAAALAEIRKQTKANLSVDLQENYRLAELVAPHVDKIRYNPGHLHHVERDKSVAAKVAWLVAIARDTDTAVRIGVNCGSVAPEFLERYPGDQMEALVQSTLYHCQLMEDLGFDRFVVSLKDSDPNKVIAANRRFAAARPDVPVHLGVTEAGLPPQGIVKTRVAFEKLLAAGIGDTLRVSLTLPNERKHEEVEVGLSIIDDVRQSRFISVPDFGSGLNIISCPSCSRVENDSFVQLAERVRDLTEYASAHRVTIAVMGCRVNGPGETDDADLGLWCGPSTVVLKKKDQKVGSFSYSEVLSRLKVELDRLIAAGSEVRA